MFHSVPQNTVFCIVHALLSPFYNVACQSDMTTYALRTLLLCVAMFVCVWCTFCDQWCTQE